MKKEKFLVWTKKEWFGNPNLNLDACVKTFTGCGRNIPIWIWGKENSGKQLNFTVNAGANSEYSYTGLCENCYTLEEGQAYVEAHFINNKQLIK